jgi:hypothetical protein
MIWKLLLPEIRATSSRLESIRCRAPLTIKKTKGYIETAMTKMIPPSL